MFSFTEFLSKHYGSLLVLLVRKLITGDIDLWFNGLLTVRRNVSLYQNQQDALFTLSSFQLITPTYFEHLLARPQEALYTQQLVYFVGIMSAVGRVVRSV
jgi:hypothetical protein